MTQNLNNQYPLTGEPVPPISGFDRQIIEASPSGIILVDAQVYDAPIAYVNTAFERTTGYTRDEVIGRNCRFLQGDDRDQSGIYTMYHAIKQHDTCTVTLRNYRKDGTMFWNELRLSPIFDSDGHLTYYMSVMQDVTEQKQTEQSLQLTNEVLERIFDNTHFMLAYMDANFNFIRVNAKYAHADDKTPEYFTGKNHFDLYPNPENEALFRQVVETGEPISIKAKPFVYPYNPERGTTYWDWSVRPVLDDEHRVEGLIFILSDVTESKQSEIALARSEQRLKMTLQGTNVGTWEWNVQTGETVFNRRWAEIVGYTLDELEPISIQTWVSLTHPDDLKESDQLLARHFAGETDDYECEARMRHKDGHWVWVLDRGRVLEWTEDGQPLRMFGTHLDITGRKHAQQRELELALERERRRLLTTFIRSAAHEFRTPLATVTTSSYLMARADDAVYRHNKVHQIDKQVRRITRLVDMLMLMAQLEGGERRTITDVDPGVILLDVIEQVQAVYGASQEIRADIAPDLPLIMGCAEYLTSAFTQLIENACRFTPEGGTVTITTQVRDARVYVGIRDTGPGIPADVLPHIFETFWRQDYSHSTPGLGLGLPIAQKIIEQHGGEITVESTPGQGSLFQVLLPVAGEG